jgi:gamma-glutamyltranspeptidase/glutathione hydrolase
LLLLLAVFRAVPGANAADRVTGRPDATRSVVYARHGMVACATPLAAEAGVQILRAGGSAVDAAIAVNAMLAVTEPVLCGLGGDLFALVWDPREQALRGLNASGRAPGALTADKVKPLPDGTIPLHSPESWTVPGAADGWFALHERFGKLPLSKVLAPAIAAAEDGFPVTQVVAYYWARSERVFKEKPGFAQVFLPGGRAPREGEIFRNPALATTLRAMAEDGRAAFYEGAIARAIVRFSQQHSGYFQLKDFANHRSTWDEPISTTYRGVTVWELPPNGQGLAALQMLNMLETFELGAMGERSPDLWHLLIETKKLAYADRARYYADPAFAQVPVQKLLSKEYARERAKLIDLQRAARTVEPGALEAAAQGARLDGSETTYLCTADAAGMMVSLIQSNYTGFGSGYVVPDVGFGIQNRGALFSLDPQHPNFLQPGKRPFHTIIPAFATRDGQPLLAFGVMGGDMQPQGHVQILVNLLDLGMNLQEAGDAPRFHHEGSSEPTGTVMRDGGTLHLESGVDPQVVRELTRRGHRIVQAIGPYGGYQAIWRDPVTGVYAGATESRKDGCAIGY